MKKLLVLIFVSLMLASCTTTKNVWQSTKNTAGKLNPFASDEITREFEKSSNLDPQWKRSVGKQNDFLLPAVDNETVYVADVKGNISGYSLSDGSRVVEHKVRRAEAIQAGVGIGSDSLYVVDANGFLFSISKASGGLNWKKALNVEVLVPPVFVDNQVILHSINGSLINVNALTGDIIWKYDHQQPSLTLRGGSKPLVFGNSIISGFADGTLVANDTSAGYVLWDISLGNADAQDDIQQLSDIDTQPVIDEQGIMYVSSYQGRTSALDIREGRVVWEVPENTYKPYTLTSSRVYLISDHKTLVALDRNTGEPVWQITDENANVGEFIATFKHPTGIYVMDSEGYAYQIEPSDGTLLNRQRIADDKGIAAPIYFDDKLIILSREGDLAVY